MPEAIELLINNDCVKTVGGTETETVIELKMWASEEGRERWKTQEKVQVKRKKVKTQSVTGATCRTE